MTPEERQRLKELEDMVRKMRAAEDVPFIKSIFRRLQASDLPAIKLSDLSDVENTDSGTTGQVLKKTATTWQPGTDIDT